MPQTVQKKVCNQFCHISVLVNFSGCSAQDCQTTIIDYAFILSVPSSNTVQTIGGGGSKGEGQGHSPPHT